MSPNQKMKVRWKKMKLSEFYDNVVGDNPFIFSAQFENAEYMQEYYENSNYLCFR